MDFKNYYTVLDVERNASPAEIKRAYRKLARKFHPDVSKERDAEARFKEVGEAYKVLKDPVTRAQYDSMGGQWRTGQGFDMPPDDDPGNHFDDHARGSHDGAEFSEFFETLFGNRAQRGAPGREASMRGQDQHAKVTIDLWDAYHGAARTISLGTTIMDASGRPIDKERTLHVEIPKGIRTGQHLRLAGQGTPGVGGGQAGDLYLEIGYRENKHFRVDGGDVYVDLPLAPWEAALGASVTAPTPDGLVQISIPPGSQAGRKLRLKGKGIPGKIPGDLYAVLAIALPPSDTEAQKDGYRAMQAVFDFDARANQEEYWHA
jgi:curved DNA-binding protein